VPDVAQQTQPAKTGLNRYPFYAPRFWHGMLLGDWIRLAWRNKLRIHPRRWGLAFTVSNVCLFNSVMHAAQEALYGRAVANTEVTDPPIFVIGHWRSGTTWLHELLVLDERFAYPTTYECFAPNHFLLTGRFLPRLIWFLLPPKRPMDNMVVSFDHPQEDEFALMSMGAPSPMLRMAFPNDPPPYMELLDMVDVDPREQELWQATLWRFVRMQTYLKRKPVVLKSPPHTGRVGLLAKMFPGARFVHIVRHPDTLFASNRRLWMSLDFAQGFQIPRHEHLDEFVFRAFERMYGGFERQRQSLDLDCICDVRYEDLVENPVREVQTVYEKLGLGDFGQVRGKVEQYVTRKRDYQPNRHQLEPAIKDEIRRRWAGYFETYGYD